MGSIFVSPDPPIFIVGVHRSGTTLLRFMLSSHSRIYIPPESDFIPYFFGKRPNEELSEKKIEKYLIKIFSQYRFVEDWKGNQPQLEEFISLMQDRTPAAFLNTLYGLYAIQNNANRWGDKTPIYASYLDVIHKIFPRVKFIHIIRDPYDSAISLLEKYEKKEFHIDIFFAAHNWVRRIQNIQGAKAYIPEDQYLELRYEILVQEPEKELRRICDFIKEPFEPSMLSHHELANTAIPPDSYFFANVREPIHSTSVGRGREGLSDQDKRIIDHVAGDLMTTLNYQLENMGEMTLPEKIRYTRLKNKYNLLQWGRRTLTNLGLLPPI